MKLWYCVGNYTRWSDKAGATCSSMEVCETKEEAIGRLYTTIENDNDKKMNIHFIWADEVPSPAQLVRMFDKAQRLKEKGIPYTTEGLKKSIEEVPVAESVEELKEVWIEEPLEEDKNKKNMFFEEYLRKLYKRKGLPNDKV